MMYNSFNSYFHGLNAGPSVADSDSSHVVGLQNRCLESDARRLYAEIRKLGKCPIEELCLRVQIPLREGLLALGWLARDERVGIDGSEVRVLSSDFYF